MLEMQDLVLDHIHGYTNAYYGWVWGNIEDKRNGIEDGNKRRLEIVYSWVDSS